MTIDPADILPDTYQDLIGAKIRRIQRIDGWVGKKKLRDALVKLVQFHQYQLLEVRTANYRLHKVGQSYQYVVPEKKNGLLKPFRGSRVRLVCLYNGRFSVTIGVGLVR